MLLVGVALAVKLTRNPLHRRFVVKMATTPPSQWKLVVRQFTAECYSSSRAAFAAQMQQFYERDGRRFLRGGSRPADNFDVSECRLNLKQFRHGIGRERFPALIEPEFVTGEEAGLWLNDEARVLAVKVGDEIKVYPRQLLLRHEVVNDVGGGQPIFAAYCVLADLGAVYERRIDELVHTFAPSGHTYYDPKVWDGRTAFVLWDRETESLWWPPIGQAVSGPMIDSPLTVLDDDLWAQTTWGEVKARYPSCVVLRPNQPFTPPTDWPRYDGPPISSQTVDPPADAIAPRWGENTSI